MSSRPSVAVVGGGPTGLLLACELALMRVPVVVLERRRERVQQARALSMHPRSIEILAQRGIADRFLARGVRVPTGHYASLDERLDFTRLDSSYPFGLVIPQTITEQLLEERALELGAEIRRDWSVATVESRDDRVVLRGTSPDGPFALECLHVVGADGARSIVRQQAGIAFAGTDNTMSIAFGDVFVDRAPIVTKGRFQTRSPNGIVEGFPMADGRHRVILIDGERLSAPVQEAVTLDEMRESARRIMGAEVELRDPAWLSRFGNETRLAETYRKGRVLLVGDAAHIHLPAGGQGMNTGLQDAMNLGWKLAGVLCGRAPDALLDTYDLERRPVGRRLLENTVAQASLIRSLLQEGDALWNAFNDVLRVAEANLRVARMITALDTTYPDPLPGVDAGGMPAAVGRRLGDCELRLRGGERTTLYRLLVRGNWILLRHRQNAAMPQPDGIAPEWVRTVDLEAAAPIPELELPAAMLVRPDGHVAAAVAP